VTEGDTLWDIAGAEYGDPQQWRRIADANGVENPRTLQVGTVLEIPPAEGA
jgi:nucleoid-associated protein YgaU